MSFCTLCGNTERGDLGAVIGICLNADACHRRQARIREHRQYVAEQIAREIEDSVPEPGAQCGDSRNERVRYRQAQADAALARKFGAGQ